MKDYWIVNLENINYHCPEYNLIEMRCQMCADEYELIDGDCIWDY